MTTRRQLTAWVIAAGVALPFAARAQSEPRHTVVDHVSIRNVPVIDALAEIQRVAAANDPEGVGVVFRWQPTPNAPADIRNRRIDLKLRNVSLETVIRCLCLVGGLHYRVESHVVHVSAAPNTPETRVYRPAAGVVDAARIRRPPKKLALRDNDD